MKIYRPQRSFVLGNSVSLIFPILLTVISFSSGGEVPSHEIKGLVGFWLIFIVLILLPLGAKIEVGDDYIQHRFLGFTKKKILRSEVGWIEYRNVLLGGLGFGKGLKLSVNKVNKTTLHSIPENMYGKEAIKHIKQVLSKVS